MHRAKSKARDALKSINVVPDLIKEITNTSRIHFETNFTFKVKRQSLLSRTLRSPYFGLLLTCTFTFFYCAAEIFSAPPFGVNSAPNGSHCVDWQGNDFQDIGVCICPRETVCVKNIASLFFLAFSRLSAYFDYPLYMLLFLSKAHNLRGYLQRTYLSEFLPLDDMHHLHTFAGTLVGFEVIWHSSWHLLRWGLAGDIRLLWTHITGISGLISLIVTPLIAFPMLFTKLRLKIDFTWRKALHYLSLVWGISICFHAPARSIGIIMGVAVGVYGLDWLYGYFFKIYRAETLMFTRIGQAVEVAWEHPKGFVSDGAGYVYICLPWISKSEWHAFSLIKHPTLSNHSCLCMAAVGDWTKAVHLALTKPSSRPGWLYGPFPSPFSTATNFDHLIAIASGIGITPSISAIVNLSGTRKVHLIWMCRDADLVEFYMKNTQFDDDAWSFIFYTGKRALCLGDEPTNPHIKVLLGRPDLEQLIKALVDNESNGTPMPAALMARANEVAKKLYGKRASLYGEKASPAERCVAAVERAMASYSFTEMYAIALANTEAVNGEPPSQASLTGFVKMFHTVCGCHIGLTDEQLAEQFRTVDTNGDGLLSLDELESIMDSLRKAKAAPATSEGVPATSEESRGERKPPSERRPHETATSETVYGAQHAFLHSQMASAVADGHHPSNDDSVELDASQPHTQPPPPEQRPIMGAPATPPPATNRPMLLSLPTVPSLTAAALALPKGAVDGLESVGNFLVERSLAAFDEASQRSRNSLVTRWQMMYCGGAAPVVKSLEDIHEKYGIPLKVESFAW